MNSNSTSTISHRPSPRRLGSPWKNVGPADHVPVLLRPEVQILIIAIVSVFLPWLQTGKETKTAFFDHWPYLFSDATKSSNLAALSYAVALIIVLSICVIFKSTTHSAITGRNRDLIILEVLKIVSIVLYVVSTSSVFGFLLSFPSFDAAMRSLGNRIMDFGTNNQWSWIAGINQAVPALLLQVYVITHPTGGSNTRKQMLLITIYSTLSILLLSFSGQKSVIFIGAIASCVVLHANTRKVKSSYLAIGLFVGSLLLCGYHIVKQELLSVGEIVSIRSGYILEDSIKYYANHISGNFMQLETLSILIDGMPQSMDFQYGRSLQMLYLLPVPRAIFPDKPLTPAGDFTLAHWPDQYLLQGTTIPPGYFGEGYMNFGFFGIALFAILLGAAFVVARRIGHRPKSNIIWMIAYAIFCGMTIHLWRGEVGSVVYMYFNLTLPMFFVYALVHRLRVT